ncbi:uncharacterized protein LOC119662352 isoform X1 [Teleopsis dalmanni]|uniref:uncharacterized protein LOC119662352 isoform X1 n=1 Tax=Teleopsis dalmanni TaxID=139649 RepID=UPI0018CD9BEB|nr:uncharacterized protein LOC119662352 isoform X1 [Teleopsis dalmanni]
MTDRTRVMRATRASRRRSRYGSTRLGDEEVDESRFLIGLVAEEEITLGFLLAGIGECPYRIVSPKNYLGVKKDENNGYICNKGRCKDKILEAHIGNLERHLKNLHSDLYAEYIREKDTSSIRSTLPEITIEEAIVQHFTGNMRPFYMLEDTTFKVMTKLVWSGIIIKINEHNIDERILKYSTKIKDQIIEDLKGKLN